MTDDCELCGLPARATSVTHDGDIFCCRGCKEVYTAVGDVNLDDRAESESDNAPPEGCESAFLHVDGMHCTACEVFVEDAATRKEGVEGATASYATETVRVDYSPERVDEEDLPDIVTGAGYTASHKYDSEARREARRESIGRLVVGGFFGMMAMVWYVFFLYPTYFGYDALFPLTGFEGSFLFANILVMTTVVLFYTGAPILRGAYVSVRARQPNMDLLITLAAVSAYVYSTVALVLGRTDIYYDVTVAVVLAVSVGNYYERGMKRRALGSLADLTEVRVDEVRRDDGSTSPVDEVEEGDRVVVREGERVPVDGTVAEGNAPVDESVVTGEAEPVPKHEGDYVVGGSVVTDDALVVRAEGGESALDRLTSLLWSLQSNEHGVQKLADRLATVFVPLVLVVAVAAFVATFAGGAGFDTAVLVALTVLIVSCPCALGLATPLAVASGVREAVGRGIVVSDDTVFERVRGVDTFVFDKTGTLTTGRLEVTDVQGVGTEADDVLDHAAAVERQSSHPVAEAVVRAADRRRGVTDGGGVTGFVSRSRGAEGVVSGKRTLVGTVGIFDDEGWHVPDEVRDAAERDQEGRAVVVGWSGEARGVVRVGERLREGWHETVGRVSDAGKRVVVLTGDESGTARFDAHDGIDRVFSGVPPEAKAETVRRLRGDGTVAMVGDGTNDAPALAAADLGIGMGGGTALASDAADVTLLNDELGSIETVVELSDATRRRTRENIGWAFFYNAVAIPLAVTGLLNPLLAAAAMVASSFLVTLNSSRRLL